MPEKAFIDQYRFQLEVLFKRDPQWYVFDSYMYQDRAEEVGREKLQQDSIKQIRVIDRLNRNQQTNR